MILHWPCPGPDGPVGEYAVGFDRARAARLLIVPALFEEANRTRRMLVQTMRRLDETGVDSFLPDLPGCNESTQPFAAQSLHGWRSAMERAAGHFGATHVLAVRGGALVFPSRLPGWVLEPVKGASILRQMIRARTISAREAGRAESPEALLETGRTQGVELAGYHFGPSLIAGLQDALPLDEGQHPVGQSALGGSALWLRSEPSDDPAQSAALARIIVAGIGA